FGRTANEIAVRLYRGEPGFRALAHSIFAPDALTSAAQRGASLAIKAAKSCGEPTGARALNLAKLAVISGQVRPALITVLILPTMGAGVPAGASTPVQETAGKSRWPSSSMVGTSGMSAMRSGDVTASARTRPAWTCGTAVVAASIVICSWPPSTSVMLAAAPL